MQISGVVQAPTNTSAADQSQPIALMGKQAEILDANLHGKYYTQAYRGNAFIGSTTAAGIVIPTYSTTAMLFGLWNPAGNSKNAVLQTLDVGLVSLSTTVVSSLAFAATQNAGSAISSAVISAFTATAPFPAGNPGGTAANTVRFTLSSTVISTTTSFLFTLPFAVWSTTSTVVGSNPMLHYDFDSGIIVPPNTALWLVGNVASTITQTVSARWYEAPL